MIWSTILLRSLERECLDSDGLPPVSWPACRSPSACRFTMDTPPQVGSNGTRLIPLTQCVFLWITCDESSDTLDSGGCLGGGSSINAMMGSRPTFAGMKAVEALGNPGWGWNDFLPRVIFANQLRSTYSLTRSLDLCKNLRHSILPTPNNARMAQITSLPYTDSMAPLVYPSQHRSSLPHYKPPA